MTVDRVRLLRTGDPDAPIVLEARSGDDRALRDLLDRYKGLVRRRVGRFFLPGAEQEDLLQEGMIGLYQAISSFEPRAASFKTFATLCIDRRLFSAVTHANRRKNVMLTSARLLVEAEHEALATSSEDPAEMAERHDARARVRAAFSCLTGYEAHVLALLLDGRSYREIGAELDRPEKSVDNALLRIRAKLRRYLAGAAG